ncbi:MAG: 50S ribosomal protein L11 [archaeon]|nr:50S ribosomal protein L11 [archaeon]
MPEISVMIEGGKATPAAPLGPALGPLGVNILKVVEEINEKTKSYAGMKVPVKVIVDSAKKTFEIEVGSPPTSSLIKKELKAEKGSANPKTTKIGNMSFEQLLAVAKMKIDSLNSYKLKKACNEVAGTCQSMGVTIEGKIGSEIIKEINEGKFDSQIKTAEKE